ncbi:MAG: glycoside hydrolase family 9 protein, partial [Pseudomonadota bacterium]
MDDLSKWSVTVNGAAVAITGLSRKANILETAETSLFSFEFRTAQNVFLDLATPLQQGDVVRISYDDTDFDTLTARYAPRATVSEAVHVNLTGYDPDDLVKKAYLSSWNGWDVDLGAPDDGRSVAQDYDANTRFQVINATTGAVVDQGKIQMAQPLEAPNNFWNNFNRTDVWEMDFSDVNVAGDYYVYVDGVGISQTFTIEESHWDDIFDVSFSGFYHQRSGIALTEAHTEFVRPASLVPGDDLTVMRTTVKISETSEGSADGSGDKPFDRFPNETTGETVDAWGGWHDAGDWDRRTQHLEAARNMIELVEMTGAWGRDDTRNIPEQGDGIPDILQEAIWGIEVFKRLQTDDGGIPGGIEQRDYQSFGGSSWAEGPVIYAYAPDVWSSWEYAAAAAKVAHNLRPYDNVAADDWLASARAAMDYAEANWQAELSGSPAERDIVSRNIAALEMYRETGETAYHDIFAATSAYASGDASSVKWNEHQFEAAFLYATLGDMVLNDTIRDTGVADMQGEIDLLLDLGTRSAFGNLYNPYAPYGWGNTATQPNHSQDVFVRMHHLTDDAALLKTIQDDVQYALGANPMNMVYMTGLGDMRGPEELLNLDAETLGYGPVPGITVYGDFHIHDYGRGFYHDIMYADQWPNVWQAPVHESWQGFSIYVPVTEYTVQQGITDMSYVTGYLAAQQAPAPVQDVRMEVGQVVAGAGSPDKWHSVRFDQTIEDAVVVMGPASFEGSHALSVRVRNVTDDGFEFQLDEWEYLDGRHVRETISWMAG